MEQREKELLTQLAPQHPDLQALWDEHVLYEKQLATLEEKPYPTPAEELQIKQLKKQKLDGKTQMVFLINQYADKKE